MDLKFRLRKFKIFAKWFFKNLSRTNLKFFTNCPVCGEKFSCELKTFDSRCVFSGANLRRHQCYHCNLIFGPSSMLQMTESDLQKEYFEHYQVYSEGDSTELEMMAFNALKPDKKKLYLNYGSGTWSDTSRILNSQGFQVMNFEPNCQITDSFTISSYDDLKSYHFDGIFSNNVLEHFRFPIQELNIMNNILKKGGKISHATPCYEYLYEYTRFHLFFYLGNSKELIFRNAKFKNINYFTKGETFKCVTAEKK
jgi:SAM-dependent methyltransferase